MHGDLNREQIDQLLKQSAVGRIGCHADGKTYIVPVGYAYEDGAVYAYSGPGMKVEMMRQNPKVCFEVDSYAALTNWKSVICWGNYQELIGKEADRGIEVLTRRFKDLTLRDEKHLTYGQRIVSESDEDVLPKLAVIYRIRLVEMTGRYELI